MRRKLISMLTPRERSISGNAPLSFRAKVGDIMSLKQYGKCVQDGTPTPDAPVDIVCNNGVLKYGKPITLDSTRYYAYISTRITLAYSGDSYSIIIPVEVGQKYKITADPTILIDGFQNIILRWGFFDNLPPETWKQISPAPSDIAIYDVVRTTPQDTPTVEITATHPYLVIQMGASVFAGNITNGRILLTEQSIYTDGTAETINVHGKNLFDKSDVIRGKILNDTGAEVFLSSGYYSGHISVDASTGYTISQMGGAEVYLRILEYDSTDTMVKLNKGAQVGTQTKTFTTDANTVYVIISGSSNGGALDTVQLERGSTATKYEPYYNGGTATAADLLSVGDYKDVQDVIGGSVVRNVGVKVFDGTEDWREVTDGTLYLRADSGIPYYQIDKTIEKITHFVPETINYENNVQSLYLGVRTKTNNLFYFARYTGLTDTVAQFKQWLADQYAAGTPVIIVYPLATPTTESVTPQSLRTHSGNNTIVVDSNVDPVEIEVKYKL